MVTKRLLELAKNNNWYRTKKVVFVNYKKHFFQIYRQHWLSQDQLYVIYMRLNKPTEEQKASLNEMVEQNKKVYHVFTSEISDSYFSLYLRNTWRNMRVHEIQSLLDFLTEIAENLKLDNSENCHQSNKTSSLDFYNLTNSGIRLNVNSYNEVLNAVTEENEAIDNEGNNYFMGFLGSILFSIPVIILWVLVAYYFNILSSAMSVLIAFAGYFGYIYFKGKQNKVFPFVLILSNICMIVLANFITAYFSLWREGLGFSVIQYLFQEPEIFTDIKKNIGLSMVLSSFTWIWIFMEFRTEKAFIKLAEKVE
jgi:hypothetical protein